MDPACRISKPPKVQKKHEGRWLTEIITSIIYISLSGWLSQTPPVMCALNLWVYSPLVNNFQDGAKRQHNVIIIVNPEQKSEYVWDVKIIDKFIDDGGVNMRKA